MGSILIDGKPESVRDDWDRYQLIESGAGSTGISTACLILAITGVQKRTEALLGHFAYPVVNSNLLEPQFNAKLLEMLEVSRSRFPGGRLIVGRGLSSPDIAAFGKQKAKQLGMNNLLAKDKLPEDVFDIEWAGLVTCTEIQYDVRSLCGKVLAVRCPDVSMAAIVESCGTIPIAELRSFGLDPAIDEKSF